MIKIALCDDEKSFLDEINGFLKKNFLDYIDSIDFFKDGEELIKYINEYDVLFDFIFLDLSMSKLGGIETGKALRLMPRYTNSIIFYITSYTTNPGPIVDVHPFAYINKPINYDLLNSKVSEAIRLYSSSRKNLTFSVSKNIYNLSLNEIVYIEGKYRSSVIHTLTGPIMVQLNLKKLEELVTKKSDQFTRINNSTIINLKYLHSANGTTIALNDSNRTILPLSRTFHSDFLKKCSDILL